MNIVLRKYGGILTPMLRPIGSSFGAGAPASSVTAFLLSPLVVVVLAIAFLIAWALAHGGIHAPSLALVPFAGEVSSALAEKRERFLEKQKELGEIMTSAKDGSVYDLSRKAVLEKLGAANQTEALEKVKSRNVELDNLNAELQVAELKEIESAIGDRETARSTPLRGGMQQPVGDPNQTKSFGQMFIESKQYAEGFKKHGQMNMPADLDIGMKTLFQTTAGYAPESVRTGLLVDAVTRPIQVLDLIPVRPISQAVDKYMEETTRTHAAAEKAEGIAYAESTFVWTERTNAVQKITDSIPVTDEQLEDAPQVAGILDQRLRFGLRQRLDGQVVVGNGTPPNLKGIVNVAGIQTQAKGTDPIFDAIFKAITLARFTGRALPNAIVEHPTDWQTIRLTRTADGQYIMGNPSQPGPMTLFGLPVALADSLTQGTGIVGDFLNFCYIGERRGIEVQVGYVNTNFTDGKKTLRADMRAVFTVSRPAAFVTVTGQ